MNWIALKEKRPPSDAPYLAFMSTADEKKPFIQIAWYNPDTGWSLINDYWVGAITHWMPLPDPPK